MINLERLLTIDIETMINLTIFCVKDLKTGAKKQFVFFDHFDYDDQPLAFYKFLRTCVRNGYTFITFNGVAFDVQILHYFYSWCQENVDPMYELQSKEIITFIYQEAQRLISLTEDDRHKQIVQENNLFIPTIDLYKQKHFDRPQRATSLKWVQYVMNYPTIQEMPIGHDQVITKDQIDEVVEYCWNDVDSTEQFFKLIKYETEVRLALSVEYDKNLINASEPRMAREIFGKFLCEQMKITYPELKQMKTVRKHVDFNDIIFPYTKFVTPEFKKVLADFKAVIIDATPTNRPAFGYSFSHNELQIYLGLGGMHSCVAPGVYVPAEDEIFEDADVTSFYPKLSIENNVRPEHLGEIFSVIYENIFKQRQLIPKKDPKNYIFKILLNSAYGLSSEINSYFYDRKFTYTITINGQLSLLMLVEALYKSVPSIRFIQKNTDGVTYIYNKKYTNIVRKICKWWERTTKLSLEYAYYSKMVVADVNNYIGVYTDGTLKKKGLFETKIEYHKNPSYMIVPKALEQHFVNAQDVNSYIRSGNNSIFDYCGGIKKKSNFKLNLYKDLGNTEICEEQQKVTRFIVSQPGADAGLLVKDFNDGRKVSALANTLVMPLNNIKPECPQVGRYPVNYEWYIKEVQKIVQTIQPTTIQTKLF